MVGVAAFGLLHDRTKCEKHRDNDKQLGSVPGVWRGVWGVLRTEGLKGPLRTQTPTC